MKTYRFYGAIYRDDTHVPGYHCWIPDLNCVLDVGTELDMVDTNASQELTNILATAEYISPARSGIYVVTQQAKRFLRERNISLNDLLDIRAVTVQL